jgi:RNA polymerase sigma factor (sigma-70 family)
MFFETLATRLSPTLKRIARKLNGHCSFMDDQDLFQEALLHLWTLFSSGDLAGKTDSYMLQGCYYHLRNYIRKTRDSAALLSLSVANADDGPNLERALMAPDISSFDEVEGGLQIEAIVESGMSQREKEVLCFSLEGMTTREIGLRLGVSHVSVVKTRNRIKKRYTGLCGIGDIAMAGRPGGKTRAMPPQNVKTGERSGRYPIGGNVHIGV